MNNTFLSQLNNPDFLRNHSGVNSLPAAGRPTGKNFRAYLFSMDIYALTGNLIFSKKYIFKCQHLKKRFNRNPSIG